jgi:kynurenine formamidase
MPEESMVMLSEADVIGLFQRLSNKGRWGNDDEAGTLNLITPEKRIQAAGLVRSGTVLSLGQDLSTVASPLNPDPIVHRMLYLEHDDPHGCIDSVEIVPHGFAVTHMDAIGHVYFHGESYNGRRAAEMVTIRGIESGSIHALRDGIVTRGVLLDVARARGVSWLEAGDGVTLDDLQRAEAMSGVTVSAGDAIFVRVGTAARIATQGDGDPSVRAGLTAACLPWIHEREIAVYSGDCIEQQPSPYPNVPLPLHMIGLAAMGLVFVDNPSIEDLGAHALETGRYEFLFTCAPLRIPGATGSAVNPLAVF